MGIPPSVRIGVLGAARITPMAVIRPAHVVEGVEVRAVAARDPKRAEAFRRKHKLDRAHECYEALINDPNVEAIYNALPNGLHAEWSIRALEAGKHVLCEKPLANNCTEAKQMAQIQKQTGLYKSCAKAKSVTFRKSTPPCVSPCPTEKTSAIPTN